MFMKRGGNGPQAGQSAPSTPSSTSPGRPDQIPFVDQPPISGLEASPEITEERVLADPTWAENQLHAALTVRALKWLELLKQDETLNPTPGQRLVTLDTQVAMFNTLTNWLKASKRTKGAGDDEAVPGIEQMRQLIREEVAAVKKPTFKKPPEDDEGAPGPPRSGGFQPGNKAAAKRPESDDRQLSIMLGRARKAASEEN